MRSPQILLNTIEPNPNFFIIHLKSTQKVVKDFTLIFFHFLNTLLVLEPFDSERNNCLILIRFAGYRNGTAFYFSTRHRTAKTQPNYFQFTLLYVFVSLKEEKSLFFKRISYFCFVLFPTTKPWP